LEILEISNLHPQGLIPARLVSLIVWPDCACQGRPKYNEALSRGFFFCGSTWTVLVEPGAWLVRKARRDFQPEFLQAHSTTS
jgi:hypothetical protein